MAKFESVEMSMKGNGWGADTPNTSLGILWLEIWDFQMFCMLSGHLEGSRRIGASSSLGYRFGLRRQSLTRIYQAVRGLLIPNCLGHPSQLYYMACVTIPVNCR